MNTDINLSGDEIIRLKALEGLIENGKKAFIEVGMALTEIRDRRLYRKLFDTFEAYCQSRWGFGLSFANHQIRAAEVVNQIGTIVPISNEGTAREFVSVPKEQRQEVAQEAKKIAAEKGRDTINSRDVKEAKAAKIPKPEPKPSITPHKVEVIEPDADAEPIIVPPPLPPEPKPITQDVESWLASLDLMKQLSGIQKRKFEAAARFYFAYSQDLQELGSRLRRRIARFETIERSRFLSRIMVSFDINDPSHWLLCGHCKGTGWNGTTSECSTCGGDGFQINQMLSNNRKARA
jgi:hypothetical protein